MSRNGPAALAFHALFVLFMVAPIAAVCAVAFTPEGFLSLPTHGLSLRWFRAIAQYPEFISAFVTSLWLGALSALLALLFAVPAALAIARHRFRGRDALSALFLSPLMIPHVVLGIAFLRFFTQVGLGGAFAALVVAHLVLVFPFALRLTLSSAAGADRSIEMAAVSLGAGGWTLFRRVVLPLILPDARRSRRCRRKGWLWRPRRDGSAPRSRGPNGGVASLTPYSGRRRSFVFRRATPSSAAARR